MPAVYLGIIVNGQTIRYHHSTPVSLEEAYNLANELNRGMRAAAYYVEEGE